MILTRFASQFSTFGDAVDLPWAEVAARLVQHDVGPKDGSAISVATFNGPRGFENLVSRTGIALDVEYDKKTGEIPPPPSEVVQRLDALHLAGVVYTTHSHDEESPRYRVVIPLREVILLDEAALLLDSYYPAAAAKLLRIDGVVDRSKYGSASLFYLPRHAANRASMKYAAVSKGSALDVGVVSDMAVRLLSGDLASQRVEIRSSLKMDDRVRRVIEAFNASHTVEDLLQQSGYRRGGRRWKSPHQSPSSGGGTEIRREEVDGVLRERWISFSDSDAAAGVGARPKKTGSPVMCFGDAFSLFRHYLHNNDFKKALEAARATQKEIA